MNNKEKILLEARRHLANVCVSLKMSFRELRKTLKLSEERLGSLSYGDKIVENEIIAYGKKRISEFEHLESSPYFVRCDVLFQNDESESSIYFAKFGFDKEAIYSWITPASVMRFEKPGEVRYRRPDGAWQKATLFRKDQYMIVDGKIKFLSSEAIGAPRELVYEEYFSTQKSGFILPEIVAQMEKAQDSVIRAHHVGPFLISGPAGSGKTTLALHRVAYLAQSPDLAQIYQSKSIVVFVQDNGTKDYFSYLLPELGISDVEITTFSEWAFAILGLGGNLVERYGNSEKEKDFYEFQKLKALKNLPKKIIHMGNTFSGLQKIYANYFNEKQKELFLRQSSENLYDRIDLTVLLKLFKKNNKQLSVVRNYYTKQKNGKVKKESGPVTLEYSLAVIDEFQNYLPDQLKLMKSCINQKTQSVVYVGDMAQQVRLGTIRQWEEIEEKMEKERKVVLEKVYRNTKNILQFIKKLGYAIEIPEQLKMGAVVGEYVLENAQAEIAEIKKIIKRGEFASLGILAKSEEYIAEFRKEFSLNKKIHAMTMNEAQGVEFDIVILVGIGREATISYEDTEEYAELAKEKKCIEKDLLYVALTRAISQLHIMGKARLEKIDQ